MANKILIPVQSFVSCFLESPANRQAAVGAVEGLWQGLLSSCCPSVWGSSVLNLLGAKDQANENCEHSSEFSRVSARL